MHDIESAWVALERAESERQAALTEELLRFGFNLFFLNYLNNLNIII